MGLKYLIDCILNFGIDYKFRIATHTPRCSSSDFGGGLELRGVWSLQPVIAANFLGTVEITLP